jgi:hypothetical protein
VPALTPGTLNDVAVTNPSLQTGTLPKGWLADFLDVPQASIYHGDVEKIFRNGVTAGDKGTLYFTAGSDDEAHGISLGFVDAFDTVVDRHDVEPFFGEEILHDLLKSRIIFDEEHLLGEVRSGAVDSKLLT